MNEVRRRVHGAAVAHVAALERRRLGDLQHPVPEAIEEWAGIFRMNRERYRLADERERLRAIDEIANWTDPGPGGFYDDLGNLEAQPHLVRGAGFEMDPAFLRSPLVGFGGTFNDPPWRLSWRNHAETLNDTPLELRYRNLDPSARYKIRVVYGGEISQEIRLGANDKYEVHGFVKKEFPVRPVEFDIPSEATGTGELRLKWYRKPGLGGNGRGCQVSEVWLIRR